MFKWSPKEDITAYDLALCMGVVIAQMTRRDVRDDFARLPESAKRHFEDLRAKKEDGKA